MFVTLKQQELGDREIFVAVVFSFPCKHAAEDDLTTAQLTKWTKGFNCKDVLDTDFGTLLHQQLKKKTTTRKLTIKVIINDAVGLLMAGVHKDQACMISCVLGKGVNGCYIKDNGPDGTAEGRSTAKMIIATEWGALGENGRLDKFRTEFDQTAITFSMSPKQQILEKMVGMLYIGEIVREVLLKLVKEGYLFKLYFGDLPALNEKRGFPTEHVMKIDSDVDKDSLVTRDLLHALEFDPISEYDCMLVKFVCRIVLRRAAYLAAAALASMVKHVHQRDITVAIDGSLWRAHPRFKEEMKAQAKIFAGPDFNVKFESILDGSEIGAALMTAVSLSRKLSFRDQ
ncbi:hypothetical protein V1264_024988 [Littorina saxatilis]|uniref:Phosphotransferase n=2 Tax=Littorina saxatilis TaxID=31220 RepID=A0AAN9G0T6_9CAEN